MGVDVRVIDAAQAVAHVPIDVVKLGVDALVFITTYGRLEQVLYG